MRWPHFLEWWYSVALTFYRLSQKRQLMNTVLVNVTTILLTVPYLTTKMHRVQFRLNPADHVASTYWVFSPSKRSKVKAVRSFWSQVYTANAICMKVSRSCMVVIKAKINPFIGTLKPQSNIPLYSNTVTLAVGGMGCYIWYCSEERPEWINTYDSYSEKHVRTTWCEIKFLLRGRCTNFILFDVAL